VFERLGAQPGSSGRVLIDSSPVSQGCINGAHNFQEECAAGAGQPTSPATVIDNIPDQDPALEKDWVRKNEQRWDKSTPDEEARSAVLHCKGIVQDPSIASPTLTCFINADALSEKVQLHTPVENLPEESIDSLANMARTQPGDSGSGSEQDEDSTAHQTIGLSSTEVKSLSAEPAHTQAVADELGHQTGTTLDPQQPPQFDYKAEQDPAPEAEHVICPSTPVTPDASVVNKEPQANIPLPQFEHLRTPPTAAPATLKVYTWRRHQAATPPTPPVMNGDPTQASPPHGGQRPPAQEGGVVTSSREGFLGSITSSVSALLPVPPVNAKGCNATALISTPRRSRQIAGMGVEFQPADMTARSKKKAMKVLKVIPENGSIDHQAEEDYKKLFSEPLSDMHMQALAALFGWPYPMGEATSVSEVVDSGLLV
jgi:hypothetical protein